MGPKLASLHTDLGGHAVVLDDRRVQGSALAVDHVVLAPSGVWLVAVEDGRGRVSRRDVGRWFRVDDRLFVGRVDRTELIDLLDEQVQAMEHTLSAAGLGTAPVHAALCVRGCTWGWFAKPFAIRGVWLCWPDRLSQLVLEWEAMPASDYERLARVGSARLFGSTPPPPM
jgi:hypothetical protein